MPGLTRFVDEVDQPIRLALSVHAADPRKRSELMPVNDRYPLADVLAECRRYVELRRRKVYVEYVMLAGVNDSPADARAARGRARRSLLQGQPHPVQPDRPLRRLVARDDRAVQGSARPGADSGDGAAHARPGHRGRLRPAGLGALMERVTGIGGVFFRARDPQALAAWYEEHLGVPRQGDETYAIFPESRNAVWSTFPEDTDYWPPAKQGMVNYTVGDLDAMLAQLRDCRRRGRREDRAARRHRALRLGGRPRRQSLRALGAGDARH